MEVSNYSVSGCNLLRELTTYLTYLYRGYNLFTKYHGHPSRDRFPVAIIFVGAQDIHCIHLQVQSDSIESYL